jgi:hypothetical protein
VLVVGVDSRNGVMVCNVGNTIDFIYFLGCIPNQAVPPRGGDKPYLVSNSSFVDSALARRDPSSVDQFEENCFLRDLRSRGRTAKDKRRHDDAMWASGGQTASRAGATSDGASEEFSDSIERADGESQSEQFFAKATICLSEKSLMRLQGSEERGR